MPIALKEGILSMIHIMWKNKYHIAFSRYISDISEYITRCSVDTNIESLIRSVLETLVSH